MPKKTNLAKKCAAEKKNKKGVADALDGKDCLVGRVEKTLGNGSFQVNLGDKMVQGLVRGVFKGGRNSEAFLVPGMFVVLACAEDRAVVHEVIGVVNKKKDLKALLESKVLHKSLFDQDGTDDIFDYSADDDELVAEVAGEAAKKNGASAAAADDIDIDAI